MDIARVAHRVAEAALEVAYPTRCVGCGRPGELICADCRAALPWIDQREACPCCSAPFGTLTCTGCKYDWETRACVAAWAASRTVTHVVTAFKDERELRLAPVIAAAMATALDEASACPATDGTPRFDASAIDAVVYVPASPGSYRRRGFDHMRLVATALAGELELPLADVLVRADARDQRELGRSGRLENIAGSLQVCQNVAGMDFLLVDDVITTGASLRACTRALLARGAHSVTAAALVRGW